ncbi:MAG: ABC transporter substrate-binding protein [Bryobacteraceae bacterium]
MSTWITRRRFAGTAAGLGAATLLSSAESRAQASGQIQATGQIKVMGNRVASFYSPLIATVAGGFLKAEGLDPSFRWLGTVNYAEAIRKGSADVLQNAISSNWTASEAGQTDLPVHIAQINGRDGFFLVRRGKGGKFHWKDLEGKTLIAENYGQPLTMLKYALFYNKVDIAKVNIVNAGNTEAIYAAFKSGKGDFIQAQGPEPQQIELDGFGTVVVSVGGSIPPVAFSSVCSSRAFVSGPLYKPFLRAFAKSKDWCQNAPAKEIADKLKTFLPEFGVPALAASIGQYQKMGTWKGGIAIPAAQHEQAVDVFLWAKGIQRRHTFDEACVQPPNVA